MIVCQSIRIIITPSIVHENIPPILTARLHRKHPSNGDDAKSLGVNSPCRAPRRCRCRSWG